MTEESEKYQKIGFKAGVEIHQQLDGKKLFCDCPTLNTDEKADIHFERRLRAPPGETGIVDAAALHEMQKGKKFIYESSSKDTCLVEFDEEPPHMVNQEALRTVLQVASMLNATIVDEIQFMRKTVVDGSNVSGFQRTALVAIDGYIETSKGKVKIPTICLEEEAAKKIKDTDDSVMYRLDRLGIPLIEIGTDPDIKDPQHAKEVAEKLGMILRSTGRVKRGLGTIRQDVNVSIKGGARVEIKGFQDLKTIPLVIENEIKRQQKIVDSKKKMDEEVRKAEPDGTTTFLRPMPGAARMYPETDIKPIVPMTTDLKTPELLSDKAIRYEKKLGLSKDLAKTLSKNPKAEWFDEIINQFKTIKPTFIAENLISIPKELNRRHNLDPESITKDHFITLFEMVDKGKLTKASMMDAAVDIVQNRFDPSKYEVVSSDDLEKEIKIIVSKNKDAPIGALMGMIMEKFNGKVDGKAAMQILRKYQ
ncbi:Glu-tRNA(Gln) amidotransferase subunit GatE [Candidatus Woesearchaeota archaeon]|nr:Glu-tRNA(Gln) amidotransferase subunit GatE [Candidatus Woesearchaeota archaeon]